MNKHLKIKTIGEDISDLFIAFLIPEKGFKVQVFKKNNIYNQINQFNFNKKTFAFLKLKFLIFNLFKLNISTIFFELFMYIKNLLLLGFCFENYYF